MLSTYRITFVSFLLAIVSSVLMVSHVSAKSFPEFTELVEVASPAVVNITAIRNNSNSVQTMPDEQQVPEIFRRFFRNPGQNAPRPSRGSGFLISADGYILTNNHVVEKADQILVALSDRREREALLVGADPLSDLALLKINEDDLPSIKIGSSDQLKVGEWVMAIGSPFGFELSVTAGIVSAKGRSLPDESGNYVPYIQTDVAINPGNSGGPLLNLDGEVVGINSQILTRSGGFMGLSFAIPIDVAMEVADQLKATGHVSRGWLGVLIQRVDRDLAESFGLDRASGALVTDVLPDSPAKAGGLLPGDIILQFNGRKIDLSSDLPHVVGRTPAETVVDVRVMRAGKPTTLKIEIGLLPDQPQRILAGISKGLSENRLGIEVETLTDEQAERFNIDEGVLVTRLGDGPASAAGLQRGDVITTLDGDAISSVDQFEKLVQALPADKATPIRVVRNERPEFLVIKVPSAE